MTVNYANKVDHFKHSQTQLKLLQLFEAWSVSCVYLPTLMKVIKDHFFCFLGILKPQNACVSLCMCSLYRIGKVLQQVK